MDAIEKVKEGAIMQRIDLEKAVNGALSDKITKIKYFDTATYDRDSSSEYVAPTCIFTCHESSKVLKLKVFQKENHISTKCPRMISPLPSYRNTTDEKVEISPE